VKSGTEGRERVSLVIEKQALPALMARLKNLGASRNGWMHALLVSNYGRGECTESGDDCCSQDIVLCANMGL